MLQNGEGFANDHRAHSAIASLAEEGKPGSTEQESGWECGAEELPQAEQEV